MRYIAVIALLWSTLAGAASEKCEGDLESKPISALISDLSRKSLDENVSVRVRIVGNISGTANFNVLANFWKNLYSVEVKILSDSLNAQEVEFELSGLGRNVVHSLLELSNAKVAGSLTSASTAWLVTPMLEPSRLSKVLMIPIYRLDLQKRTHAILRGNGIYLIGDLVPHSVGEVLRFDNLGRRGLNEIQNALSNIGLRLEMETPGWPPENMGALTYELSQDLSDVNLEAWNGLTLEQLSRVFDSKTVGLGEDKPKIFIRRRNERVFVVLRLNYFLHSNPRALAKSLIEESQFLVSKTKDIPALAFLLQAWKMDSFKTYTSRAFVDLKSEKVLQAAEAAQRPFNILPPNELPNEPSLIVLPLP